MGNSTINGLPASTTLIPNDQFVIWSASANGTRKVFGDTLDKLIFRVRPAANTSAATTSSTLGTKQIPLISYNSGVPVIEVATYNDLIGNAVFDGSNLSDGVITSTKIATNIRYNPWLEKTANYVAIAGDRIFADTGGGPFTITLPANPAVFDTIIIADIAKTWPITGKNLIISRNSKNINGLAQDLTCDVTAELVLRFEGTTQGWRAFAYGY